MLSTRKIRRNLRHDPFVILCSLAVFLVTPSLHGLLSFRVIGVDAAAFQSTSFSSFQFASNGVAVRPRYFVDPNAIEETANDPLGISDPNQYPRGENDRRYTKRHRTFTMRNVPGEGDCMFLAVALATLTRYVVS